VLTPSSSSVLFLGQEPILILDSGASCAVVSTSLLPHIHNSQTHYTQVATAAEGQSLHITGEGELGPLTAVLYSDNIRHNCIHDPPITFALTSVVCSGQHLQHRELRT
jgi:hypothetical protein